MTEQCIEVRSKALKCMGMVVQDDPNLLSRDEMQESIDDDTAGSVVENTKKCEKLTERKVEV